MTPGYLQLRTQLDIARWYHRWALQGGTQFTRANDLQDMRTIGQRAQWTVMFAKLQKLRKVARAMKAAKARRGMPSNVVRFERRLTDNGKSW